MTEHPVEKALADISRLVTRKYQKAIDREWKARGQEREAELMAKAMMGRQGRIIRRYIQRALAPHRIEIGRNCVDFTYGEKPPKPHCSLDVAAFLNDPGCHSSMRMRLTADLWPHSLAELDSFLFRIRAVLDAHVDALDKITKDGTT